MRWAIVFAILSVGLGLSAASGQLDMMPRMVVLGMTLVVLYQLSHRARPVPRTI